MLAVALNPLDLAVAAGRFYGGHPPFPYVPGCEAVARTQDGDRVYVIRRRPRRRAGRDARRARHDRRRPARPGGGGRRRRDGGRARHRRDHRLERDRARTRRPRRPRARPRRERHRPALIAVQRAKLRGAERIVAAGRDPGRLERARELGADETVTPRRRPRARRAAATGPTVVIDPLWGEPVAAAVEVAAPRARIVHSASPPAPRRRSSRARVAARSSSCSASRTSRGRTRSCTRLHGELLRELRGRRAARSTSRRSRWTRSTKPGAGRVPAPKQSSSSDATTAGPACVAPTSPSPKQPAARKPRRTRGRRAEDPSTPVPARDAKHLGAGAGLELLPPLPLAVDAGHLPVRRAHGVLRRSSCPARPARTSAGSGTS